ncbi:hypothetical protein [uncultured Polaribacter sp.]|uniref:hypothetical protein n=1 Tax=uncultured Polaribacter sp. TaxID=174711 RepID=UPI002626E2BE|nr:hypothetical protein [uncultured Polaribacter sp.]
MIIITKLLLLINITLIVFLILVLYKYIIAAKALHTSQLNYLFLEIEKEKIISEDLEKVKPSLIKVKNNTQIKLNTIKVQLLNISFSISEVLK